MKVSFIIANYNTKDLLIKCTNNLLHIVDELGKSEAEIIIVDNDSIDGSVDAIIDKFGNKVQVYTQQNNTGISTSYNIGTKKSKGDYIVYVGSDCFPSLDTINHILSSMNKDLSIGISTARLVKRDETPDLDAHRGFPTPWAAITHFTKLNKIFSKSKIFNKYYMGWLDLHTNHEIDVCISHFMVCKRDAIYKIDGWDEDYFVFGEDIDFCYRIKQAGYKVMYFGEITCLHYKGASVGRKETSDLKNTTITKETKTSMKKASTDAMKLFYTKHYTSVYPKIVTSSVLFAISVLGYFRVKKVS